MKKLLTIVLLAFALTGCATLERIQAAYTVATSSTVTIDQASLAINSFRALEITATNYLQLPRCTGANGPICRDPGLSKQVVAAIRAGRVARNDLKTFMRSHQTGNATYYNALISASDTIRAVIDAYNANR